MGKFSPLISTKGQIFGFLDKPDTIIATTANPISEKLCFRVINPSQLTRNWDDHILGLPEETFDFGTLTESGDYIIFEEILQLMIM